MLRLFKASTKETQENKYRALKDYKVIKTLSKDDKEEGTRHSMFARRRNAIPKHPLFTDKWYILKRDGQYGALIEKTLADIYQYFLGYSTQIDIVKTSHHYYAASREVKDFLTFYEVTLKKDNLFITEPNGAITYQGIPVINLGKISVLSEFFADSDSNATNYGLQKRDDTYYAFKIDNERAFNFDHQLSVGNQSIDSDLIGNLHKHITEAPAYLREKEEMLRQIADTDFTVIEKIIRNGMQLKPDDPKEYSIDEIINKLKARHEAVKHHDCKWAEHYNTETTQTFKIVMI